MATVVYVFAALGALSVGFSASVVLYVLAQDLGRYLRARGWLRPAASSGSNQEATPTTSAARLTAASTSSPGTPGEQSGAVVILPTQPRPSSGSALTGYGFDATASTATGLRHLARAASGE